MNSISEVLGRVWSVIAITRARCRDRFGRFWGTWERFGTSNDYTTVKFKSVTLLVPLVLLAYCRIGRKADRRRAKTSLVSCLALQYDAFWTLPSIGVCVRKSVVFEASLVWGLAEDEAAGNERERDRVRDT